MEFQVEKRGLATGIPLLYKFQSKTLNKRFLWKDLYGNRQKTETKHCRSKGIP